MSDKTFQCARCGKDEPRLSTPPLPGPTGQEVVEKSCANCWHEWTQAEVMVINELRLNFMDPGAQRILIHHMREFLGLGADPAE